MKTANWFHRMMRFLLENLAMLHWKNHLKHHKGYPQLWYCWPKWTRRKYVIGYALRVRVCGWLTGHEISKTEWGYGGGNFVDRHCRWCDKVIKVPKAEEVIPNDALEGPARMLGW